MNHTSPTLITFDQLANGQANSFQNQSVIIRGFVYPYNQHTLLSSQPNLKTCCIGTSNKLKEQIILSDFSLHIDQAYAVNLQGILKIEPRYNETGTLLQYYVLEKPSLVQNSESPQSVWLLILLFVLIFLVFSRVKNFITHIK